MRPSVDDYHDLLARAASVLKNNTPEGRQELYHRVRTALEVEFGKLHPPPSNADFLEERRKLDVAIFDFEFTTSDKLN